MRDLLHVCVNIKSRFKLCLQKIQALPPKIQALPPEDSSFASKDSNFASKRFKLCLQNSFKAFSPDVLL